DFMPKNVFLRLSERQHLSEVRAGESEFSHKRQDEGTRALVLELVDVNLTTKARFSSIGKLRPSSVSRWSS
ncbi:MAG: hypothetical protein MK365_17535, partial [Vicinamibacterales bacterium]|nr:hypothetical protein [Vicinamibacterales bacterium]